MSFYVTLFYLHHLQQFKYIQASRFELVCGRPLRSFFNNWIKDTPLIWEFTQYSVLFKNQGFSLNDTFNYFHRFGTERWRSEICEKITQKYESSLWRHLSSFLWRSPKIVIQDSRLEAIELWKKRLWSINIMKKRSGCLIV